MSNEKLIQYGEQVLGGDLHTSGNEMICDCISCGKQKHMYFNVESGLVFCHKCEYGGNLFQLIVDMEGVPYAQAVARAYEILERARVAKHRKSAFKYLARVLSWGAQRAKQKQQAITLPGITVPISAPEALQARRYLKGRGFGPALYKLFNLRYVVDYEKKEERRYMRHVVFPVTNNATGDIIFWTTRATYKPKYGKKSYHPSGVEKRGVLYGIDHVKNKGVCFIVEGPLDAIAFGGHACALLGKHITDEQAHTIAATFKHAVICLDSEVPEFTTKAAQKLRRLDGCNVSTTSIPWDDPADALLHATPGALVHAALRRVASYDERVSLTRRLSERLST